MRSYLFNFYVKATSGLSKLEDSPQQVAKSIQLHSKKKKL